MKSEKDKEDNLCENADNIIDYVSATPILSRFQEWEGSGKVSNPQTSNALSGCEKEEMPK